MADLPAVTNDHENIRHTVLMMGIPDNKENIFEVRDGSWKQMNELEDKLNGKVKCRTKELKNQTGVGDKDYEKGLLWDRIKKNAMLDESNYDYVTVSIYLFNTSIRWTSTIKNMNSSSNFVSQKAKEK